MRVRNFTFVLFGLLGVPAFSSAGPIDITYTARGDAALYPGQWSPGDITFVLDATGNIRFPASGESIELGAVILGPSPGPQADDSYTAYVPFSVSVMVTEQLTGQSATLELPGGAVDAWDYRPLDGTWTNRYHMLEFGDLSIRNARETSAVVGNTRYTLSVRAQNNDQEGVYTLSAVVTSPEPGTFALAALGLVPLAARRFWKKQN